MREGAERPVHLISMLAPCSCVSPATVYENLYQREFLLLCSPHRLLVSIQGWRAKGCGAEEIT